MSILPTLLLTVTLLIHPSHASNQFGIASNAKEEIPTVDFCELVKYPHLYFDKTIRLTATYEMATEAQYLSDVRCVLGHDDRIGVRYVNANETHPNLRSKYGGNPVRVTLIGKLRNSSRRDFAWYRYRFDIIRFEDDSLEDVSRMINSYEGTLQEGMTYRARVRGDKLFGLALIPGLKSPAHQAVRIEWMNLKDFPALVRLRKSTGERQIILSVVSVQISRMTEQRWNRTVRCKIMIVE